MKSKKVTTKARTNAKKRPKGLAEEQSKDRHERIAMRAYQLYLARGGAEGDAITDWLEAEREIGGQDGSGDLP